MIFTLLVIGVVLVVALVAVAWKSMKSR